MLGWLSILMMSVLDVVDSHHFSRFPGTFTVTGAPERQCWASTTLPGPPWPKASRMVLCLVNTSSSKKLGTVLDSVYSSSLSLDMLGSDAAAKEKGREEKGKRCKGMYRDMRNASSNIWRHKVNTEEKMRLYEQVALNESTEGTRTKQTQRPN